MRVACPEADISYTTMPVLWGTASGLDLMHYDVVVHIGLGVYEGHTTLLLEKGAYNERRGADASAQPPPGHTIEHGAPQEMYVDSMQARYSALAHAAALPGDFQLKLEGARPKNAYLCNETHYRALKAVDLTSTARRGPSAAYFLHIPYARMGAEDDHSELAAAVATLLTRIVRLETEQGQISIAQ